MSLNLNLFSKVSRIINNPYSILIKVLYAISPIISDKLYLKLLFPLKTGYRLNLSNPKSYNEKLQWLKLYYRNSLYPNLVDKFEFKNYAKNLIDEKHIVKTLGIWNSFDEINFDLLPAKFVLKTTHDQGGIVICNDKDNFNFEQAKFKLERHLGRRSLFFLMREWPYKYVKPRILAEEFLSESDQVDLKDYKFYCFDGIPKILYVSHGRQNADTYLDYYDLDFNKLDIRRPKFKQSDKVMDKPSNFNEMVELARTLSEGHPHVRIDFYNVNNNVKLGEFTLFQGGGMMPFYPIDWDFKLGSWIDIEKIKKNENFINK